MIWLTPHFSCWCSTLKTTSMSITSTFSFSGQTWKLRHTVMHKFYIVTLLFWASESLILTLVQASDLWDNNKHMYICMPTCVKIIYIFSCECWEEDQLALQKLLHETSNKHIMKPQVHLWDSPSPGVHSTIHHLWRHLVLTTTGVLSGGALCRSFPNILQPFYSSQPQLFRDFQNGAE